MPKVIRKLRKDFRITRRKKYIVKAGDLVGAGDGDHQWWDWADGCIGETVANLNHVGFKVAIRRNKRKTK